MRYAIEHETVRRLPEANALIETFGIFLSFYLYDGGSKVVLCSFNGMQHYLLAIATASIRGYDPAYRHFLHVGSR